MSTLLTHKKPAVLGSRAGWEIILMLVLLSHDVGLPVHISAREFALSDFHCHLKSLSWRRQHAELERLGGPAEVIDETGPPRTCSRGVSRGVLELPGLEQLECVEHLGHSVQLG